MVRFPQALARPHGRPAGFTLVEMIVTLAITALVVAVAAPALSNWMGAQAALGNADELAGTLRFARSEAIKRSQAVTVCASSDGQECDDDWATGWVVIAGGQVLRAQNAPHSVEQVAADASEVSFTSNGLASLGGESELVFGFMPKGGGDSQQVDLHLSSTGKVCVHRNSDEDNPCEDS